MACLFFLYKSSLFAYNAFKENSKMNEIISKKQLSDNVFRFTFVNEDIAKARKPGQFLILRVHDKGERIPLTIADSDAQKGTVDIIFQAVGKTTNLLSQLKKGDSILDAAGPLGSPTHIENYGNVLLIAGGVGAAVLFPVLKALKEKGNQITCIVGARDKDSLILINEIKPLCKNLYITTNDGSAGQKGFVTDVLSRLIEEKEKIDYVYAVGPVIMMKKVSEITKEHNIKTDVSLNPIMIDGTGMCGGCRVIVKGNEKFACVHGPDFNAHDVNFDLLLQRLTMFKDKEQHAAKCMCDKDEDK
jgi:ferredoxin--NADP+ reductase